MQKDADRLALYAAVSLLLPVGILALGVAIAWLLGRSIEGVVLYYLSFFVAAASCLVPIVFGLTAIARGTEKLKLALFSAVAPVIVIGLVLLFKV